MIRSYPVYEEKGNVINEEGPRQRGDQNVVVKMKGDNLGIFTISYSEPIIDKFEKTFTKKNSELTKD